MKQKRFSFFPKKMQLKPVLLTLCPCLVIFSIISFYTLFQLQESTKQDERYWADLMQSTIDSRLDEINGYTVTLEMSRNNTALKQSDFSASIPQEAYRLLDNIRNFVASNSIVDGMYIYYPDSGYVVGDLGCHSLSAYRSLQQLLYSCHNTDDAFWADTLVQQQSAFWHVEQEDEEKVLYYIRPWLYQAGRAAVTVIEISPDSLLQAFSKVQQTSHTVGSVAVILEGQGVLAMQGDAVGPEKAMEYYSLWRSGESPWLSYQPVFSQSNVSDLVFANFYPPETALSPLWITAFACVLGAVLIAVFSLVGAVFVKRSALVPVHHALSKLGLSESDLSSGELLDRRIDYILQAQSQTQKTLFENQMLLDSDFFHMILRGELRSEGAAFAAANRYGVYYDSAIFQVIVFSNAARTFEESNEQRTKLYHLFEATQVKAMCCVYRGRLCVLINTDNPLPSSEINRFCRHIFDAFYPNEPAAAGVGSIYDSLGSVVSSYYGARRALLSNPPSTEQPITVYTPEMLQDGRSSPQIMHLFTRYMQQNEFHQARKILEQLVSEYLRCAAMPSGDLLRQSAVNNLLADAAMELLGEQAATALARRLSAATTWESYAQIVQETLERLEQAQLETACEEEKQPVAVRAKELLEQNFTDPMMGLYYLSERLNVSNSYLSSSFKNTYQVGLVQYMNMLRIERAKELITQTNMSIKEIALAVGYSSDINFIRVFKKQENKTPTMLRSAQ